jgi:hypothetical protein
MKENQTSLWKYSWSIDDNKMLIAPNINTDIFNGIEDGNHDDDAAILLERYFSTNKPRKQAARPRDWRTRADPFESVWDIIQIKLELNPHLAAKPIIDELSQLSTLQGRVAGWREAQWKKEKETKLLALPGNSYQDEMFQWYYPKVR